MKNWSGALILSCLMPLAGCGVGSIVTTSASPPNLSGNWQIEVLASPTSIAYNFLGALSQQGSAVTGVFRVEKNAPGASCVPATQDIVFSGSINAAELLTLTSASFAGSVATIQLQFPLNAASIANGIVQIAGDSCALTASSLLGVFVPPVTGTYTATLTQVVTSGSTGTSGPATLTMSQSAPNSDGQFPITGSISYSSPICTVNTTLSGTITGLEISLTGGTGGLLGLGEFGFTAGAAPSPKKLAGGLFSVAATVPGCPSGLYQGTFTSQ